jgi:PAS domain S-box-containing protein
MTTFMAIAVAWFFRRQLQTQKSIDKQLKFVHENLDFALQSGRMGTWDIHLEDGSVNCSKEMLELWGVTAEEYAHRRSILQSKVHSEDLDTMIAAINKAIEGNGVYEFAYRIFPKPGQLRWVLSRGRCAFAPGSKKPERFSGVVFDITESKLREEALEQAVRARDQFLTIAGHELKTPLTNMHMQIQLRQRDLQRNYPAAFTAERVAAGLAEQLRYVRRLNQLVDNLLDAAQIAEGHLQLSYEYFDLCKLVRDVVERFREATEATNLVLVLPESQAVYGHWDWFRLEQILLNLLGNALKYGGVKPVHVSIKSEQNEICIIVRDHGRGIPHKDQARIFERFERAISENEVSGMGLGLYISQNIARLHGGEIRLRSEADEGAEFSVILPIEKDTTL